MSPQQLYYFFMLLYVAVGKQLLHITNHSGCVTTAVVLLLHAVGQQLLHITNHSAYVTTAIVLVLHAVVLSGMSTSASHRQSFGLCHHSSCASTLCCCMYNHGSTSNLSGVVAQNSCTIVICCCMQLN